MPFYRFRAAEYVKALDESIEKSEDELSKLQMQYSALEMILQQYENFSMDAQPCSALQVQMVGQNLSGREKRESSATKLPRLLF